jgi:acetate kinase
LKTEGLGTIGHRLVNGGEKFVNPTLMDDKVILDIEAISGLAPLLNTPALSAIRSAQEVLNSNVPMVSKYLALLISNY